MAGAFRMPTTTGAARAVSPAATSIILLAKFRLSTVRLDNDCLDSTLESSLYPGHANERRLRTMHSFTSLSRARIERHHERSSHVRPSGWQWVSKGLRALQVVEQGLERDARASEDRDPSQNALILDDDINSVRRACPFRSQRQIHSIARGIEPTWLHRHAKRSFGKKRRFGGGCGDEQDASSGFQQITPVTRPSRESDLIRMLEQGCRSVSPRPL